MESYFVNLFCIRYPAAHKAPIY